MYCGELDVYLRSEAQCSSRKHCWFCQIEIHTHFLVSAFFSRGFTGKIRFRNNVSLFSQGSIDSSVPFASCRDVQLFFKRVFGAFHRTRDTERKRCLVGSTDGDMTLLLALTFILSQHKQLNGRI